MTFKKYTLVLPLLLVLINCTSSKATLKQEIVPEVFQLKTFQDSVSYAMGLSSGEKFREMPGQIFDLEIYQRGVSEGYQDSIAISFSEVEMRRLFGRMNDTVQKIEKAKKEQELIENKRKGEAFLTENKGKEGIVTTASGLQYKILQEGTGETPAPSDRVKVHYEGKLLDGTIFDSSYERREPIVFGVTQVISGWTEGLQLMKEGGKYRLFIPGDLAYGERGAGQDIAPNETLIFDIELLEIQ